MYVDKTIDHEFIEQAKREEDNIEQNINNIKQKLKSFE